MITLTYKFRGWWTNNRSTYSEGRDGARVYDFLCLHVPTEVYTMDTRWGSIGLWIHAWVVVREGSPVVVLDQVDK